VNKNCSEIAKIMQNFNQVNLA